jgi:hypothetical protein
MMTNFLMYEDEDSNAARRPRPTFLPVLLPGDFPRMMLIGVGPERPREEKGRRRKARYLA